jgi:hypothetical protein
MVSRVLSTSALLAFTLSLSERVDRIPGIAGRLPRSVAAA